MRHRCDIRRLQPLFQICSPHFSGNLSSDLRQIHIELIIGMFFVQGVPGPPKMRIAFLCGFSVNHHVILKEPKRLKDLRYGRLRLAVTEILRCAQDDLRNKYVLISNA